MLCFRKFIADNFASLCSFKNTCLKNHASVELFWINSMDIYFWKRRTLYFTLNVYEAEYIFFTLNCFQQYSYIWWKIPSRILLSSSYSPNKNYLSWTLGIFLHALVAKKSADCDDSQFCPREFSRSRFWHHFGLWAGVH